MLVNFSNRKNTLNSNFIPTLVLLTMGALRPAKANNAKGKEPVSQLFMIPSSSSSSLIDANI